MIEITGFEAITRAAGLSQSPLQPPVLAAVMVYRDDPGTAS